MQGFVAASENTAKLAGAIQGSPSEIAKDFLMQALSTGADASVALMEGEKMSELQANTAEDDWKDVEFEVALDSGCTDSVCHALAHALMAWRAPCWLMFNARTTTLPRTSHTRELTCVCPIARPATPTGAHTCT